MQNSQNWNQSSGKRDLFSFELKRLDPHISENQISLYADDCSEIPIEKIAECFKLARQANTRFKIPIVSQIISAWIEVKKRANTDDWKQKDTEQEKVNYDANAYYMGDAVPWCYMSERNRYLLRNQKNLTDEDELELYRLRAQKVRPNQLRLNEKIQSEINKIPDPDTVVSLDNIGDLYKARQV